MESPARWASFAVLCPSGVPRVWVAPFWDHLCTILAQRQEPRSEPVDDHLKTPCHGSVE